MGQSATGKKGVINIVEMNIVKNSKITGT